MTTSELHQMPAPQPGVQNLLPNSEDIPQYRFPEVIDNTLRKEFSSCPYKAMLSSFNRLAPKEPSIHLHFGACIAAGLETTRKAYYGQGLDDLTAIDLGQATIRQKWGDYDPEGNGTVKSLSRCLDALELYFLEYPLKSDHLKPLNRDIGAPAVEFSFALSLPINHPDTGNPLLYAGRFDMLAEYNGVLFAVDEKTSSQLGASWGKQWDLASQFSGYCYAAQQYGYPVAGAVIRGIGLLKTQTTFAQHITYRPKWLLDAWYEQLLRDIERMIFSYKQGYFDKSFGDACSAYAGCGFKQLCSTPNPENWIAGQFTERHWNPLDKGD